MKKSALPARRSQNLRKNAAVRACIHIETNNPALATKALKDVPLLYALEFLFVLANRYRHEKKFKKMAAAVETSGLLERPKAKKRAVKKVAAVKKTKPRASSLLQPSDIF